MLRAGFQKLFVAFLAVLLPVSALGASVAETLKTPDAQIVSRGEFIRSSVQLLEIPAFGKTTSSFTRPIPKALQPYVSAAEQKGALAVFGKDLSPARGITRIEAVQVLAALSGLSPKGQAAHFSDIPKDTAAERAARVAVEKGWYQLPRRGAFGAAQVLKGREAKDLLRRLVNEEMIEVDTGSGSNPIIRIELGERKQPATLPNQDLLKTIWQLLNNEYLYKDKLDGNKASYDAAEALVQSLKDPYTSFMPPAPAEQFRSQLGGEVTGIGAQVEFKDNILTIVAPLPGSPALTAGLKSGDQILKVNGEDLAGLSFVESVAKVRGPKGSSAVLTIKRDGATQEITVTRDTIKVPEIDVTWQGNVAIVRIVQFGARTENELRGMVQQINARSPRGFILDLRNNPGGLLDAATIALSDFLPKGTGVAHIVSRTEDYLEKTADEPTLEPSVPMVVLVNKGSASASEIVAGALQDAKRATIVGEQTFGKGTVQQVMEFRDGSGLKMTVAEWFTPLRRKIDGVGVKPDVIVPAVDDRDEQLLKAIELLR